LQNKLEGRTVKWVTAACCFLFALALLTHATQQPDASTWVFNYPSTPLRLSAIGEHSYELKNVGATRIVEFQLGCVAIQGSTKSVVTVVERQPTDIDVSQKVQAMAMHVLQDRQNCVKRNAQLVVVWARFDDGAEWTVGQLPPAAPRI
jgi:hypothetical protein